METLISGFPGLSADHCLALYSAPECEHDVHVNRTVRATDEQISTAVEHMQQVARLTAGIALQSALIDGKQPADELILELLQLGSVTNSQMTSIDGKRLRKTLKSLKDLPNALVDSKEVQEVEKRLEEMEELRVLVKVAGGGSTWEGKVGFIKEMDDINKNGIDLTQFSAANNLLSKWRTRFDDVMNNALKTSAFQSKIEDLKDSTDNILKLAKEWTQPTADLLKYPTIESAQKSLSPLSALIDIVQKALYMKGSVNPQATDKDFDTIKNNINRLSTLSASLESILPDLQTVQNILEARESHVGQSLKYPGFANGLEDLKKAVFEDFSDEWLQTMVDRDRMGAALKPIKTLIPAFTRVDEAFDSFSFKDHKSLSNLLSPVNEVRTVSRDLTITTSAFDEFWKCKGSFSQLDSPSDHSVQQYLSSAKELDTELNKLRGIADAFVREWNNPETIKMLNDVIGQCVVGDDAVLVKTIDTLRESQTMQTLNDVMKKGDTAFKAFQDHVKAIQQDADKLKTSSDDVDHYVTALSNYQPLFKCLQNFEQTKASLVTAGIGISRKFRAAKGDVQVVEEGEATVDGVLNAVAMFGSLKDVVGKMKGASSPESDALRALPNLEKHSEVIGRAARGFDAMKKSLDWRAKADIVIGNMGVVETHLASAPLNQEDKANLDAVVQLKVSLPMMYQQLESWKGQDIGASSPLLGTYSTLFSAAQSVSGVSGDLRKMSSSVKNLIVLVPEPTARAQLEEVQMALAALASVGIDFASYTTSFTDSQDTLTALDTFFVNQRAKTTTVAPLLVAPPQQQSATAQTVEPGAWYSGWFAPFCGVSLASVITLVVAVFMCCKNKTLKRQIKEIKSSKDASRFQNVETLVKTNGSSPSPSNESNGTASASSSNDSNGAASASASNESNGAAAPVPPAPPSNENQAKPSGTIAPTEKSNKDKTKKSAGKSDPSGDKKLTDVPNISKGDFEPVYDTPWFFDMTADKYLLVIIEKSLRKTDVTDDEKKNFDGKQLLDMLKRKWKREKRSRPAVLVTQMCIESEEKRVYFKGSILKLPSKMHLVMVPSPKEGTPEEPLEGVDQFLSTVVETGARDMISLVRKDEWGKSERCCKFFEPNLYKVFKAIRFAVTNLQEIGKNWNRVGLFDVENKESKVKLSHFKHDFYTQWNEDGLPEDLDTFTSMAYIYYRVRNTILIHSPDPKRLGLMAYILFGFHHAHVNQQMPDSSHLQQIRELCPGSMTTEKEYIFANMAIIGCALKDMGKASSVFTENTTSVLKRLVKYYDNDRKGIRNPQNGVGGAGAAVRPPGGGRGLANADGGRGAGAVGQPAADGNNLANAANNGGGGGAGAAAVVDGNNLANAGIVDVGGGAGAAVQPGADGNNLANAANNGGGGGAGAAAVVDGNNLANAGIVDVGGGAGAAVQPAPGGGDLANGGALGAGAVAVQPVVNGNNGPMNGVQGGNDIANVENGRWVTPEADRDEAGGSEKNGCCTIL